jgi:repressor LexA
MVPSAAQMAEELGLAGESSVSPQLRVLEYKGYLHIQGGIRGRQRFITLTPRAKAYLKEPGYPVMTRIPAGPGREGPEVERFVERLEDLLSLRQGDFFMIVPGDSMEEAGILAGDWVLLRPGVEPAQGEVAAVIVGDEPQAVLRQVFPDVSAGTIHLRAAHPAYPERVQPAREVRVVGVMRGLVRPGRD